MDNVWVNYFVYLPLLIVAALILNGLLAFLLVTVWNLLSDALKEMKEKKQWKN